MANIRSFFVFLSLVALILILYLLPNILSSKKKDTFKVSPQNQSSLPEILINETKLFIELADTPEKRTLGLAGRTSLKENEGMFFDYKIKDSYPIFWMKGMLIPLDIIWINDGIVVQIDANIPIPNAGAPEADIPKYPAKFPVDYVLEVNAGFTQKHGISVGNVVDLPEFN